MEKENKKMKEKVAKAPKAPKEKKAKKNMPEGYIGRPKPMKTKTFEFHKPTKGFWIGMSILAVFVAFIVYIVIRLVNVGNLTDAFIKAYLYDEEATEETYVLENDKLKFELDSATTQFSVLQKDTGHVWYSTPKDVEEDPIALTKEKNNMKSNLLIKYSTVNGVENIYDTYTYSIKRNFYDVSKKGDTVTVHYTASTMEREYKYPLAIYEEEMEEYLEQMSSNDKNVITRRCYRLVDIDNLKASDNEAELLRKYPGLEDDNLYLIFDPLNAYLKENCEAIFTKIGYTDEAYQKHHDLYKEKTEKSEPAFNITVNYKLDGDKLIVDIPYDEILYKHAYPLVQLSVLPYFGAANTSDNGFMFVPEGSGSIINFNNGKTKQNNYYADVYGWDYASDRKAVIKETRIAYPVFGVSFEDSSFISYIDEGAEYAGITAEISGKLGSYNYVRADYKMVHGEQFEVSSRNTSAQYSYEPNLPEGESIKQVYQFLPTTSYVDMAKAYRNHLFGNEKKLANKEMPVAVEIIGAIDKKQQVAGIPKTLPFKLTGYTEAANIIKEIDDMGFNNVSVKLSGFFNEGIKQTMLKKFKITKQLGGKAGFKKMVKMTADSPSKLYLDGSVQFAYRSGLSDGFWRYRDPARFASDEVCELSEYSPIWYGKDPLYENYYLLKPSVISHNTNVFVKNAKKYGFEGVSFRDNGSILSGDYNDDRIVSRAAARKQQIEKFQEINNDGIGIMINSGNDYAVKNADFITNVVLHGNDYAILDKQVPFYSIVLHGYRNFATEPYNLGYETEQILLESAESGAALNFMFMHETEKMIQETNYSDFYAACFNNQKDNMERICKDYNQQMQPVMNSLISGHDFLDDKVTLTTYENGYKVIVNFGYVDFTTADGKIIPSRSYKVLK